MKATISGVARWMLGGAASGKDTAKGIILLGFVSDLYRCRTQIRNLFTSPYSNGELVCRPMLGGH